MSAPLVPPARELDPSDDIQCIEAAVRRHLSNRVRDFHLLKSGSGLVLLGQSTSYYAKQLAQHAVHKATSMTILANNIEVCPVR